MSNKLEAQVRDPSLRHTAANKLVTHKRMHFGHGTANGWPDDLFLFNDGHHWWVEFKATGKTATPKQAEVHKQMRYHKADVSVIDNFADFMRELSAREREHCYA